MDSKRGYIEENLAKGKRFSEEYQPSSESKKKGHEKRRKMREMLDLLLEKEITSSKGEKASTLEAISVALIKKAMSGDVKAYTAIRDTIGEMPVSSHEITGKDGEQLIQKIYVTPKEVKEVKEHIEKMIND